MTPWWFKLFKAGYPTCCVSHARYYFMAIYDIGDNGEATFKMGLN